MNNLTIVIPFFNGHEYLPKLLLSLPENIPVLIIDDLSDLPVLSELTHGFPPYVGVARLKEKGYFSGAVNAGISMCNTDVLVLNQDTWFTHHELFQVLDYNRSRYAMMGERIQGENVAWPNGYIHGTAMFLRRDAIERVGLLDTERYPLWGSTALWQLKACRMGFEVLPFPTIPGFHHARPKGKHFGSSIDGLLKKEPLNLERFLSVPPLVSVVIPSYNHAEYLPDAIHSLIGGKTSLGNFSPQTFQSFEIIIVDDASTDNTPDVCRDLCVSWHGIRCLRHVRNQGTAAAHNTGIKAALGKYITTMSADDMRESWALEELVKALEKNPHSLVYDNMTIFAGNRRIQRVGLPPYDFSRLLEANMVPVGTMYTKKAWEEVGGYPEALKWGREDWGFAIAMGRAGYCGVRVDRPGYLYRREGQNRTERNTTDAWKEKFKVQMVGLFPDVYNGRFPMACCGRGGSSPAQNLMAPQNQGIAMSMAKGFPGMTGMTLIEYTGRNVGDTMWGGHKLPSRNTYIFGNNEVNRVKLVDNRDVQWFLEKRVDGKSLFRRFNQPQEQAQRQAEQPEPIPVKPLTAADAENNEPLDMKKVLAIQSSKEIDLGVFDESKVQVVPEEKIELPVDFKLDEMTVKDVLEMEFSKGQWQTVYDMEKKGRNRKTLISVLEEKIAA